MIRRVRAKLALAAGSTLVGVLLFELGVRLLIAPSAVSYGRVAGVELPPLRLGNASDFVASDLEAPYQDLTTGGLPVTRGDLWGLMRDDPVLGYAPRENARSARGWWQSNDIGARSRTDTPRARPAGRRRALVFGDSFTNGSRVPQEETWPYLLDDRAPGWDFVNLAVDGYGMGQALLRYRLLRDRVEHDAVLLGFVPRADVVRDVNTLRSLMGGRDSLVMPRFVLAEGELGLIPSPFEDREALRRDVLDGSAERLISHLRRYDALYSEDLYRLPPLLGRLVSYKLLAGHHARARQRRIVAAAIRPGSEALELSRAIVDAMAGEASARGNDFVLVYIPLVADAGAAAQRESWRQLTVHCPARATCIDLLGDLTPISGLDTGRDGTHFGPRTNARIAEAVYRRLPSGR